MRHLLAPLVCVLSLVGGCSSCTAGDNCISRGGVAPSEGANVVEAAKRFLQALDYDQRGRASYGFDDADKHNWSNLPDGVILGRPGVRLGEMTNAQCESAAALMFATMPKESAQQLVNVMRADDALANGGVDLVRWSSDNYFFAVYGEPSASAPWEWQVNGHHLALTATFVDGNIARVPDFLGLDPIELAIDGALVRPMEDEARVGPAVARALSTSERADATIEHPADGVLLGAGQDGKFPAEAVGVVVGDLDVDTQALVRDVVLVYLRRLPEPSRALWLVDIDATFAETRFAWSGDVSEDSVDVYYRVHGPAIWIELSRQPAVGDSGPPHYHSVMRDPRNDYGAMWLSP